MKTMEHPSRIFLTFFPASYTIRGLSRFPETQCMKLPKGREKIRFSVFRLNSEQPFIPICISADCADIAERRKQLVFEFSLFSAFSSLSAVNGCHPDTSRRSMTGLKMEPETAIEHLSRREK